MKADFVIEEVTDLEASWRELKELCLELHTYHEPYWDRRLRDDWEARWRDYVVLGPDRLILIARSETGEAMGYCNARIQRDYGLSIDDFGFIEDAYVQADARRQGLGSMLLERAESWLQFHGIGKVRLNVVAQNDLGVDFWTKAGFEIEELGMTKRLG